MSLPLILHIEDDEQDRRALAQLHRRYAPPSVLLQVPSAEQAREVMGGADMMPVLLLVDLRLPGEKGQEFVRWARYQIQDKKLPIVAITGVENVDAAFEAVAAGADQILLKSLANQPFEERVREIFVAHLGVKTA
ncbi:MAG: response regulator [Fimbriimonas sp.]